LTLGTFYLLLLVTQVFNYKFSDGFLGTYLSAGAHLYVPDNCFQVLNLVDSVVVHGMSVGFELAVIVPIPQS